MQIPWGFSLYTNPSQRPDLNQTGHLWPVRQHSYRLEKQCFLLADFCKLMEPKKSEVFLESCCSCWWTQRDCCRAGTCEHLSRVRTWMKPVLSIRGVLHSPSLSAFIGSCCKLALASIHVFVHKVYVWQVKVRTFCWFLSAHWGSGGHRCPAGTNAASYLTYDGNITHDKLLQQI